VNVNLALVGAVAFGALIGWYVYFINRYRKGDVQFSDLVTVVGIIGGGTVFTLFGSDKEQFGAYGVGLFVGFFGYFAALVLLVRRSQSFTFDWFLDGRRQDPPLGWGYSADARGTGAPMLARDLPDLRDKVNALKATVDATAKASGIPD
jgi:hypothetical protein